ncbi:MAG: hypothetical protein OXU83_00185, partial [Gammaproteobacteria bacterium]|nr:hypothetical protein [Gammaproteobacteria bacterium]
AEMHRLHGEAMGSIEATRTEMHKLHGEAMGRMDVLQERVNQTATAVEVLQERTKHMATKAEMHKLHGEAMERMDKLHGEAMGQMDKLHGKAMERIGNVETRMGVMESDLKSIKWIVGTLGVAIVVGLITIIAGLAKLIFFPVV